MRSRGRILIFDDDGDDVSVEASEGGSEHEAHAGEAREEGSQGSNDLHNRLRSPNHWGSFKNDYSRAISNSKLKRGTMRHVMNDDVSSPLKKFSIKEHGESAADGLSFKVNPSFLVGQPIAVSSVSLMDCMVLDQKDKGTMLDHLPSLSLKRKVLIRRRSKDVSKGSSEILKSPYFVELLSDDDKEECSAIIIRQLRAYEYELSKSL